MFELDEAVQKLIKTNPNVTSIELFFLNNDLLDLIKNNPNVIRKGRWLYYKYNNKLLYIRICKFKEPKGFKTFKATRLKPELVDYLTKHKPVSNGSFEIKWDEYKIKEDETK